MSNNPFNLFVRFLMEFGVLFATGFWGWKMNTGGMKYVLMILIPVILATIWGVFAVTDDPSRSGKTVVAVPGIIRLIIELSFFGIGSWAFYKCGFQSFAWIFLTITIIHYLISLERVLWLLKQ